MRQPSRSVVRLALTLTHFPGQVDGFTYERSAITQWLERKMTSPVTGQPLESKALIPNHFARSLILSFKEKNAPPEDPPNVPSEPGAGP